MHLQQPLLILVHLDSEAPQLREFHQEILKAKQAGRGPEINFQNFISDPLPFSS